MLTNEQWELYLVKYKNLMWTISHRISGDAVIANIEDNFSDLCVAALESMRGYQNKTGKTFDEYFGTELFDKYTKTVLWNSKNKKGKNITKKRNLRLAMKNFSTISEDNFAEEIAQCEDRHDFIFRDQFKELDSNTRNVVEAIVTGEPTDKGSMPVSRIMDRTGLSVYKIGQSIDKIRKVVKKA